MNDLEICKAIANIEGVEFAVIKNKSGYEFLQPTNLKLCLMYDPLADDGLCFRMMIQHEIEMYKIEDHYYCEWIGSNTTVNDKSPRKSLCLAIIAKYARESK